MDRWRMLVFGLVVLGMAASISADPGLRQVPKGPAPYVADEILVMFQSGVSEDQVRGVEKEHGLSRLKIMTPLKIHHFKIPPGVDVPKFLEHFRKNPRVRYAEPNYRKTALACSYIYSYVDNAMTEDCYYRSCTLTTFTVHYPITCGCPETGFNQWGIAITRADQAAIRPQGIRYGNTASGTIIAIMDTGVRSTHEDLQYLTDLTTTAKLVPGWNFVAGTANTEDDNVDIGGHGTHCAGVAGAASANGIGIMGVAGNCRIMPVKVLDEDGAGTDASIVPAYTWAADHGAKVLSCSYGGSAYSQIEQEAILYAYQKGCLVVAASGNEYNDSMSYPAGYAHVLAVGATDGCDQRSAYSNTGAGLSVVAPGGAADGDSTHSIISTSCWSDTSYSAMSGTSFATPLVAGLAGVLFSIKPGATPETIQQIIERTADPVDGGTSGLWNGNTGYGRINIDRAVGYAAGDTSAAYQLSSAPAVTRTYNYPNPFSQEKDLFTNIVFLCPRAEEVTVKIFDSGGDLVWDASLSAGQVDPRWYNFIRWDGRNKKGDRVANGVYFYRITGAGLNETKKIAVLR